MAYDERQQPVQAQLSLDGLIASGRLPLPPGRRPLATVPLSGSRSLIGAALGALHNRSRARTGRASRLAAAVQNHAMTFAGLAAVDVGMFHLGTVAGWVAVGVSLFLADFKIQG